VGGCITPRLQADAEEVPHPRRQIEGGHVAGHVEQFQAEERHDVAEVTTTRKTWATMPRGAAVTGTVTMSQALWRAGTRAPDRPDTLLLLNSAGRPSPR
jgi:hypothetical protein